MQQIDTVNPLIHKRSAAVQLPGAAVELTDEMPDLAHVGRRRLIGTFTHEDIEVDLGALFLVFIDHAQELGVDQQDLGLAGFGLFGQLLTHGVHDGRAGELGDIVEITAVPGSLEAVVGHLGAAQEFFGIEVGGHGDDHFGLAVVGIVLAAQGVPAGSRGIVALQGGLHAAHGSVAGTGGRGLGLAAGAGKKLQAHEEQDAEQQDVHDAATGEAAAEEQGADERTGQKAAEQAPSVNEFTYAAVDPEQAYGFVAVAAGEGLKSVFTDLAADAVVSGGQTMNPSTEDIVSAVQSVPAKTVFVLPNNKNIIMAAEQAQKLADRQVVVLPTRTVPMGITALLNFDPSVNAETNTINMMAAADKVSTGLITYAARDSEYDGKRIRKGEIMALENGKIVSTSTDITKATYRLARGMCKKDSSFVTIISGCDVSDEDAEKVTEMVKAKCPNHVEVSHIRGGQPVYYYMISVE